MPLSIHVILAFVSYFVFSAAVGAMSEPSPEQQRAFYGWLYRFLQAIAANASAVAKSRLSAFGIPASLSGGGVLSADASAATFSETRTLTAATSGRSK